MRKNNNKKTSIARSSVSSYQPNREFEIFKSRVANAVLDYMDAQSDSDLLECLEKSRLFLANISSQMEMVFEGQKETIKDQNNLFEIGDDLFSISQQSGSNSIH